MHRYLFLREISFQDQIDPPELFRLMWREIMTYKDKMQFESIQLDGIFEVKVEHPQYSDRNQFVIRKV